VKFQGFLNNLAWQVIANNISLIMTCNYNDGVHTSSVTLTEEFFLNVINPGEKGLFIGLFNLPEEAIVYSNGVETARQSNGPQFDCNVIATSQVRSVNTTFKWSGTVNCSQLVRTVYQFTDELCPCDRDSYSDMICRYEWDCRNDGVDVAFIVFASVGVALDLSVGVYLIVMIVQKRRKVASFATSNELTAKKNTPGVFGNGDLPLSVIESVEAETATLEDDPSTTLSADNDEFGD
jgi:hypothetical protein